MIKKVDDLVEKVDIIDGYTVTCHDYDLYQDDNSDHIARYYNISLWNYELKDSKSMIGIREGTPIEVWDRPSQAYEAAGI